jgi:flagellar export protein FliJ
MAFRFPLEVLRQLRASQEHQQELLLAKANQRVLLLEQQIAHLESLIHQGCEEELRKLEKRVAASELQFDIHCRWLLAQQKSGVQKELASALSLREKQRQAFRQARRRREILDSLRTHQLELFREEEKRQEQRRADEQFLLRSHRPSPG